jgi:hypothetical protein
MENAGTFYGHLEYFTVIRYILWPFGNVAVIWYIFPRLSILSQEKSGNPVHRNDSKKISYFALNNCHTRN